MAATTQLSKRLPLRTLALCAVVLCIHAYQTLHDALLFERVDILHGQLWRLLSGNLVHHSDPHLLLNLAAMLVAGAIIESRDYRHYSLLLVTSALSIGCAVLLLRPDITQFAGLSGVVTAAVVYLCLHGLYEGIVWRRLCIIMLAALCLKLSAELLFGASLEQRLDETVFLPLSISHIVGALAALGIFLGGGKQVLSPIKIRLTD